MFSALLYATSDALPKVIMLFTVLCLARGMVAKGLLYGEMDKNRWKEIVWQKKKGEMKQEGLR